jgi:hypothetical protein
MYRWAVFDHGIRASTSSTVVICPLFTGYMWGNLVLLVAGSHEALENLGKYAGKSTVRTGAV